MNTRFGKNTKDGNNTMFYIGIVISIVIVIGFVYWFTTDNFTNFKNTLIGGSSLKDLDVVMFMSPECPWCQKTVAMLEKEGKKGELEIVDITQEKGAEYAKQFGADKQPIPSFISKKMKTGAVGYRDNVADLVKALTNIKKEPNISEGGDIITQVQQLQIVLFAREGCPWCTKAKEDCEQSGVMDVIQVVDITTPEGKEMAGKMLPKDSSGVPAFVSMATKKSVIGFKPIVDVVENLK